MLLSKAVPLALLSIGIFLLMQVVLPIGSYQLWLVRQSFNNQLLISPKQTNNSAILGVSIQSQDSFLAIVSNLTRETKADYQEFYLTVPKLKIDKAEVLVDSNDLSKNLAHLPGSALPGEKGNVFISGHSALNRLFSQQTALFANLTDLQKGDLITIDANGASFKYQVDSLKVVDPTDLSVINAPENQGRYISLMTCVPPGFNFKRLIVLGKMI